MKTVLIMLFAILLAAVSFVAYAADHWVGVVASRYGYGLFCVMVSLAFGAAWSLATGRHATLAGLVAFGILAAQFALPPPSARILRSAMLEIPAGTDADAIETIVKRAYEGSDYVLPRIYWDTARNIDRVHVSLLSQDAGDCTSLLFLVENGVVVKRMFVPD